MKYTVAGDPADRRAEEGRAADGHEGAVRPLRSWRGPWPRADPAEQKMFKGQDVMAANCTYLGDSLAAVVFFRDARSALPRRTRNCSRRSARSSPSRHGLGRARADETDDDEDEDGPFFKPAAAEGDADADSTNSADAEAGPDAAAGTDDDTIDEPAPKPQSSKPKKPKADPADWWKRRCPAVLTATAATAIHKDPTQRGRPPQPSGGRPFFTRVASSRKSAGRASPSVRSGSMRASPIGCSPSAAALSMTLCIAVCVLWARSYHVGYGLRLHDRSVRRHTRGRPPMVGGPHVRRVRRVGYRGDHGVPDGARCGPQPAGGIQAAARRHAVSPYEPNLSVWNVTRLGVCPARVTRGVWLGRVLVVPCWSVALAGRDNARPVAAGADDEEPRRPLPRLRLRPRAPDRCPECGTATTGGTA